MRKVRCSPALSRVPQLSETDRVATASAPRSLRRCTGCGATVEFPHGGLSTRCSYCESPMVDDDRATEAIDAIVPFRIPERGALERVRAYLDGRRWAPDELAAIRVHPRGLRGVLVPLWVYDGIARSNYRARVGVHWYRRETYNDKEGNKQTRVVQETEWFPLRGTAVRQVEDQLISASRGLSDDELRGLEPFDLGWAQPVGRAADPRLLSGFEAELPTIADGEADRNVARALRDQEARRITSGLLPGDRNRLDHIDTAVEVAGRRLVLFPVWIASYRHGDLVLRLLVNGQTGVVTGRVPLSKRKLALAIGAALLLAGLIALLWWVLGGRP